VAQSERLFLAHRNHLGHLGDAPEHLHVFLLAAIGEHLLQFRRLVEMIFDAVLAPAGDEDDFFDAGVHRFLHHVLNRGNVDDRQEFFGYRLGRWKKTGS